MEAGQAPTTARAITIPGQRSRLDRERLDGLLTDPRAHPSPSECKFLATQLATHGASTLEIILSPLSLALLPSRPPPISPVLPQSVASAWSSLSMLSIVAQAVNALHKPSATVISFTELVHHTLLDEWQGITGWIAYMLSHLDIINNHPRDKFYFIRGCANLLLTIATGAKHDAVKEDLATQPSTIDCVYLLLGCKGHSVEAGWYCDVPNERDKSCTILELFRACFEVSSGSAAMRAGIHRRTRKERGLIARSLERRGEELIWGRMKNTGSTAIDTRFNPGSLRSLLCLIGGVVQLVMDAKLWEVFVGIAPFLHTYSYAFANISEMAEDSPSPGEDRWQSLGSCAYMLAFCATRLVPKPRVALADMFEAGHFLRGAAICFANIDESASSTNKVFQAVEMTAPYLYLWKIYSTANSRNVLSDWIQRKEFKSAKGTGLLSESRRLLQSAGTAGDMSTMCSSFEHKLSGRPRGKDMICSGCKMVIYCSTWCQTQDWKLHSRECKQLAMLHSAANLDDLRLSLRAKRDQRRTLEGIINLELPRAWDLNESDFQQPAPNTVPGGERTSVSRQSLSIFSFDFMASNAGKIGYKRISAASHFLDPKLVASFKPWVPRIEKWVRDVKMNWRSTILVDGIFRINSRYSAIVLAIAGGELFIAPDGKEEASYKIFHTIFSIVPSNS